MKTTLVALTVLASGALATPANIFPRAENSTSADNSTGAVTTAGNSTTGAANATTAEIWDYKSYPECNSTCAVYAPYEECESKALSNSAEADRKAGLDECSKTLYCPKLDEYAKCQQCVVTHAKNVSNIDRGVQVGVQNAVFGSWVDNCKKDYNINAKFTELTSSAKHTAVAGSLLIAIGVAAATLF